ncbi:hypothetical protein D477_003118 [Arthrobacter crystallopoietes BAB-32]|uniref:DUF4878 domain-containing protein n=1 Tax=Arthrobacter crystallopoietes BAB-32 TaxID=1246476 RepID=N1V6C1_9MICC|nr:hypothetical protein [Arthrobacter crystallopoietes]EMY35652.1 hypothetical protein D477_003118 [Arthrobacter crystallopoietes BAB-32]
MSKIARALGVPLLALAASLGAAACGSSSPAPASTAPVTAESPAEQKVEHAPADVAKTLNAFFKTSQKEAKAYMGEMMANPPAEDATDEETAAQLKAAFPKSYGYLDMSEEKSAGLVGIFALLGMFTQEPATISEDAIELDGDKASILGSDIDIKAGDTEETAKPSEGGKVGKISLEHDGTEWKITDVEVTQ